MIVDRPIIFSAPMVLGLLREVDHPGTGKTMTRRLAASPLAKCQIGDRLWVRESGVWYVEKIKGVGEAPWAHYMATDKDDFLPGMKWKPSIHMPRWASRLTLTVTERKFERLQDISEDDARAEGIQPLDEEMEYYAGSAHRHAYARLWCDLHGEFAWDENPKIVAISFRVDKINIDQLAEAA